MHVDWNKIDTVLLDMDGTLLDLQYDNYFWQVHVPRIYAGERGISVTQSLNLLKPIFRERQGSLEWYCIDYWSDELLSKVVYQKFIKRRSDLISSPQCHL